MKRAEMTWKGFRVAMVLALASVGWGTQESPAKETKVKAAHLLAAVAEAIRSNCPGCVIDKATREIEHGVTVYDIEFRRGQGEMDVAEDGSVIDYETVSDEKEVPAAAFEAIRRRADGGKVKQIARDEIRAELKEGKVLKLDTPKYVYEADLVRGDKVAEIQVDADGQVIEAPKWKSKGDKEN